MDKYIGQRRRYYATDGSRDDTMTAFTVTRKRAADEMFAGEYDQLDDGDTFRSGIISARELDKWTYVIEEDN